MRGTREPLGVIGVGYVGLVTAACFADRGHRVVCRDIDPVKVAMLQAGQVPIHEPGLAELVARNRDRLRFTLDLDELFAEARIAFVCVDTPPTVSGDADLSRVQAVIDAIPATATGAVLVMKSTVPVGTGGRLRAELDARGLGDVGYVSNPEFLREGTAVADFSHPDRVVIGAEREADGDRVEALYDGFDCPIVRTDVPSAEMVKLASNAFLATKISFINEIANVCEEVGADVAEVARGMGLDPRIGPSFLRPGVGYGGSCLAGDETVLVRRDGEVRLAALDALFEELADEAPAGAVARGAIEPDGLEVLAYEAGEARFARVAAATRRPYAGDILTVVTAAGRRLRCTPDHPFVVAGSDGEAVRLAEDLRPGDRLPVAGSPAADGAVPRLPIVHPAPVRSSAAPSAVAERAALPLAIDADERFWRLVGRYLAAGTTAPQRGQRTLAWVVEGADRMQQADEIADYFRALDLRVEVVDGGTATTVSVISETLAVWWADGLGAGRGRLDRRLPDAIWSAPASARAAVLAGLGDVGAAVAAEAGLGDALLRLSAGCGAGWDTVAAVEREPFAGPVFSLEVPGAHTFAASGGLVTHNCFPKDVAALKQLAGNSGYHFQLLASVIEVNELQKRRVVNKLQRRLGDLRGRRVALLGLAFKPNTDDMREAASLVLAGRLVALGASVVAYDPIAAERARPLLDPRVELARTMREALVEADAAVIVTEWDEFRALLDPAVRDLMRRPLVLDGRNLLAPEAAAALGYEYESVGRPTPEPLPVTQ